MSIEEEVIRYARSIFTWCGAQNIGKKYWEMMLGNDCDSYVVRHARIWVKGKSSDKLQREFASLRKQYWGQRMWARGYFACSTGNITDEMIKEYIDNHGDQDDDFHVE